MTVSGPSTFFSGSNRTRLFMHGITGHTDEIVDVSCTAKPCDSSSRRVRFSEPPVFGVWLTAGVPDRIRATAAMITSDDARGNVMRLPPEVGCHGWAECTAKNRGSQLGA